MKQTMIGEGVVSATPSTRSGIRVRPVRARSRDSGRKDGWAAKAWVCNAIGNSSKPQSLRPTAAATKEKIQKLWTQFVSEGDSGGLTELYGLMALAFRSMVEGGECFTRRHIRPLSYGLTIPLQIQSIETGGCILPRASRAGDAGRERRAPLNSSRRSPHCLLLP
jgi:capsid protein